MSTNFGSAGSVIIFGLVVVFVILIFLVLRVTAISKIVNGTSGKVAGAPRKAAAPMSLQTATAAAGNEDEIVAAISAAVYAYMSVESPGVSYAIKSIKRASSGRPVWCLAGMQQNTRPF